jgi:hypothetical protein
MYKRLGTIIGLGVISLIGLIPLCFTGDAMNEHTVDVYIFSDRLRYPENIAYDVSSALTIIFFIYLIRRLVINKVQRMYITCFLTSSVLNLIGYFLYYSQYVSLFQIPVLIGMIIYVYKKHDNEKRRNIR